MAEEKGFTIEYTEIGEESEQTYTESVEVVKENQPERTGDAGPDALKSVTADAETIFHEDPDASHAYEEPAQTEKTRNAFREILSCLIMIAAGVAVALFLNKVVFLNSHIPSSSMEPTIATGDNLLGLRAAYWWNDPERGDIIIFRFPDNEEEIFIKRVIGLPGDTVVITDGKLYINGTEITENYLGEPMVGSFGPYVVPENSYFVLGDNRNSSEDSRYWKNTYVPRENILARAWLRYSPNLTNLWNR